MQRAPLNPRCEELYGAPHLTVHRADLLAIIASGFPADRLHLGHRLVGLEDTGDHVAAWFESGARITTHLCYELARRNAKYAVGSACIGGGQGIAVVLERV